MQYITMKHVDGLAIISWLEDDREEEETLYDIYIDVYDLDNRLIFEDGIGGCDVDSVQTDWHKFVAEIRALSRDHFRGLD